MTPPPHLFRSIRTTEFRGIMPQIETPRPWEWRRHRGRANFELDHARDATLATAGYEVLRFTWRQIVHEPEEVVAPARTRLTPALTQPRWG